MLAQTRPWLHVFLQGQSTTGTFALFPQNKTYKIHWTQQKKKKRKNKRCVVWASQQVMNR